MLKAMIVTTKDGAIKRIACDGFRFSEGIVRATAGDWVVAYVNFSECAYIEFIYA